MVVYCETPFIFNIYPKRGIGPGLFKGPRPAHYGPQDHSQTLTLHYVSLCRKQSLSPSSNSRAATLLGHKFLPPQDSESSLFGVALTRIFK